MRRFMLVSAVSLLAAAPLAAQAFEGTVSVKMSGMGGNSDAQWFVKGDKIAATILMPGNAGPMAGKQGKMIIDGGAMTATMLIPMEMGNSKGMKSVTDLRKAAENAAKVEVKSLGTTAMIAGYHCEDFQMTEGKTVTVVCITSQLGHFAMASGGMMGGANNWAAVFQTHPGFPLRVVINGKPTWEVTGVKPGPVSPDMFSIPEGYMELPDFGGMSRGRGGRGGGR